MPNERTLNWPPLRQAVRCRLVASSSASAASLSCALDDSSGGSGGGTRIRKTQRRNIIGARPEVAPQARPLPVRRCKLEAPADPMRCSQVLVFGGAHYRASASCSVGVFCVRRLMRRAIVSAAIADPTIATIASSEQAKPMERCNRLLDLLWTSDCKREKQNSFRRRTQRSFALFAH